MAGKRYYTCNYNYFDVINSEEKAYWLGFIYADGCLQHDFRERILKTQTSIQERRTVSIALQGADNLHLEKFIKAIEGTYPVKIYKTGVFPVAKVLIEDRHFYDSLVQYGLCPRKSLVLEFPELPELYIIPFIRGYFDGDGCLSKHTRKWGTDAYEFNIVGTKEMLNSIRAYLPVNQNIKLTQRHPENNTNCWTLRYGGNQQTFRAMTLLYENASIYLDRKYKKYQDLTYLISCLQEKSCRVLAGEPVNAGCVLNDANDE